MDLDHFEHPSDFAFVLHGAVQFEEKRPYEFKDIMGHNPVDSIRNTVDEYVIAFLNAGIGGRIFWGIRNDGVVVGIKLTREVRDELRKKVTEKLQSIQPALAPTCYGIELHQVYSVGKELVEDSYVVEVFIAPPLKPEVYFTGGNESWIKTDAGKTKLAGPRLVEYVRRQERDSFLSPGAWRLYFEDLLSFTGEAQRILAYQDLHTKQFQQLSVVTQDFMANEAQLLVIKGAAGTGKSAFVKRFIGEWAEAGLQAAHAASDRPSIDLSAIWLPIYFSLRSYQIGDWKFLADQVLRSVNRRGRFWEGLHDEPRHLLSDPVVKWLICLDGLDEIWQPDARTRFVESLRAFADSFPRLKIVLTTRPVVSGLEMQGWRAQAIDIQPLSEEQIKKYVSSRLEDRLKGPYQQEYDEVLGFLQSDDDLWKACSVPAYLEVAIGELVGAYVQPGEIAVPSVSRKPEHSRRTPSVSSQEFGVVLPSPIDDRDLMLENPLPELPEPTVDFEDSDIDSFHGPPIRKAVLLDRIYRTLWRREEDRGLLPPDYSAEWRDAIGHLAVWADGRRTSVRYAEAREYMGSAEALTWVLNLGILVPSSYNWVTFFTELSQVYFAASFLYPFTEQQAYEDAQSFVVGIQPAFKEKLCLMLSELTNKDIAPLFKGGHSEQHPPN